MPVDGDEQWRELRVDVIRARETRQRLLAGDLALVAQLEELLFRHDPIGLNFEYNTDEYRSEAETITLRLPEADTEHALQRIIHEEFVHWFGADIAGHSERYASIARETWQTWRATRRINGG
jgi:hypothetical protein